MTEQAANACPWWGDFEIPHRSYGRWQIGPLDLWVQRLSGEWRIAREIAETGGELRSHFEVRDDVADLLDMTSLSRYGVSGKGVRLNVRPALADRPVVSKPERPFRIPAGERVTVYVGSPLWIQITTEEKAHVLDEFPVQQPPDTWFGLSLQEGEVCYASRSFCRLRFDEVQPRPHRSLTRVIVENQAASTLDLERIKLPVPYLSLYSHPDTRGLWTEDVVVQRVEDEGFSQMEVKPGPPAELLNAALVAAPRRNAAGNLMVRAFARLFRG